MKQNSKLHIKSKRIVTDLDGIYLLFFGWAVLVVLMAVIDAFTVDPNLRISAWLVLFFASTVFSVWLLLLYPGPYRDRKITATIATVFLSGLFLGLYNAVWQICMGIKQSLNVTPVPLYPFPFTVYAPEWYGMIALGFIFIGFSLYLLHLEKHR